jgi:tetratricopeptide (TPR) repeat protein/transglutaminase-like putative cysteine protease
MLLCLVSPAWLRADDDWPVSRGPSREPLPFKYDPKTPLPKEFLDAGACVLYSGSSYVVEEDGTVEATTHEITRLNSRKAIERLGEYRSIYFDPTFQKLVLHEARVRKTDGKIVPIESRNVNLRDAGTDYFAYNRDKQLVISFPNLQLGDIIEVKWSTRGKNPEFFGKFFTRYTFGDDTYPTARDELRVRLPKSMPFTHAALNGKAELDVKDEGKTKLYRWAVTNRPELPQDDYLPKREDLRLQVACSTFESWAAVGEWKTKLRKECWECTPEIKDVVREVTKDLGDPVAKARALTYWVRKRIRYVSVSASGSGYTPQLPSRVLTNLYGDCKDQSQLLAVMLREAGIDVELITLGTLDDGQVVPDVPMPWGTHAILLATIDHRPYWIDTTVTNAPWDFLPRDDRDRIVYATTEGRIRLLRTPPLATADHRYETTTHLTVRPDGTAICKRQTTYVGTPALTQRDAWFETAPAERRRLMTAELQDSNSRTKLRWLKVDEASLTNLDQPVKAEMEFEIPGAFARGDRDEKDGSVTDSRVWSRLLSYNLDYDRQVPLDLGNPFESTQRWVVQLPPAYRFVSVPFDHDVRSPWGHFWVDVQSVGDDQRCTEVIFHIRMEKTVVQPADFLEFRKFQEDVYKVWRSWMSIAPTRERSDIPSLLMHFLMEPDDSDSALVLAQLLRDDGQRDKARRVLQVARFFQPQSLPVWEMTVRLAPSLEDQERACRNLVRFFPDQAKYCVELGELCVKLNDHAGAYKVLEPLTKHSSDTFKGQAYFELAKSALAQNKADQALDYLLSARAAGAARTRGVDVSLLEGEILERLKKPVEAADAYRNVLVIENDNATALGALVRLEIAADRYNTALDYLRRYTLAVEADRDGLVQAGNWYLELGRTEEALELALKAREMKFSAGTQRLLGMIYAARGQQEKAVLHLSRANLDPEVLLVLMRGNLQLGRLRDAVDLVPFVEQFKDASKVLRAQAALVRDLGELRTWYVRDSRVPLQKRLAWSLAIDAFLCADLAHQQGKPLATVEGLLAKSLEQPVDCAPALALRGQLQLDQGRLGKALADAEQALKLDPWEARAYLVRGRVRLERLDERALTDLERAAHLTRRVDAKVLHWLATAEHQSGQDAAALATQTEAAKLRPNDPEIAEQLKEFQKLH